MLTIYTAIFNNYDELLPIPSQDIECRFILFTDRPWYTDVWGVKINIPEIEWLPPKLKSGYIKTHSHSLIDWPSLWIDGNIILKRPDTIGKIIEQHTKWILCFKHFERDNLEEELNHLIKLDIFDTDKLKKQLEDYKKDWYKFDNWLSCSAVLYRENTPKIARFNEMRWKHLNKYSYRDQASMHYCAWKNGVPINYVKESFPDNIYIWYRYHAKIKHNHAGL